MDDESGDSMEPMENRPDMLGRYAVNEQICRHVEGRNFSGA